MKSAQPNLPFNILEAISKIGFWFKVSRRRSAGQERGAEVQPAPLLTGSSTRILKYSEGLKRGPNTETCLPHRKRHLRLADWASGIALRAML